MKFLADVNLLIARSDPNHEFHNRVYNWLGQLDEHTLYLCPLTENALLRIYGHPSYPGGPGSPEQVRADLITFKKTSYIRFIPDDISFTDGKKIPCLKNLKPKQITDLYLLALAVEHGLKFATMDESIHADYVHGGPAALVVIPRA